jgi:uncharacterized membrane protein YbhN (UPF0104 family)
VSDDIRGFYDAAVVFGDRLGDVVWRYLLIAIAFYLLNLLLRTRAWYAILRAAYPEARGFRWRSAAGAYLAGVGVNAVAPARGGDIVKLYLVRMRIPDSSAATILATLLVETLFDSVVGPTLFLYAYLTGAVPSLPSLPSLHLFEFSFALRHPRVTLAVLAVLLLVLLILLRRGVRAARDFWARVRQGFAILHTPRRFALQVIVPQALGWCCRVVAMLYFLRAFGIDGTLRNAVLVLVIIGAGTLLPFTPGGVGTQQALSVVVLRGAASRSALLSFSVGTQVAITLTNVIVGTLALIVMFRSVSLRKAIKHARASETAKGPA